MPKLFDRVKFNTSTTGTGDITIGSVSSAAFLSPSEAGCADGDTVRYIIVDGTDFEEGVGTVADSVATLQRTTVTRSKVGGVAGTGKLNLSGAAVVALTLAAADVLNSADVSEVGAALLAATDADAALTELGGSSDGINIFKGGITSPTTQVFKSGSGTYITPVGVKWIKVRMVGGGAGGSGGDPTHSGGFGTNGGDTTFGTFTAGGGQRSLTAGTAGAGGSVTGTPNIIGISGGGGQGTWNPSGRFVPGGNGGLTPFGGAGAGGALGGGAGAPGVANTGGGGGGGSTAATGVDGGAGGGGGAYIETLITSPAASYSYSIGAGGSAGAAGTNGFAAGAGGSGLVIVEEYYG